MRDRKTRAMLAALTLLFVLAAAFSGPVRADSPDAYYKGYNQGFKDGVTAAKTNQSATGMCSENSHYCTGYQKGYLEGYYSILTPEAAGIT